MSPRAPRAFARTGLTATPFGRRAQAIALLVAAHSYSLPALKSACAIALNGHVRLSNALRLADLAVRCDSSELRSAVVACMARGARSLPLLPG